MTGNSILTIDMITREALRLFVNSNAFMQNIDRQYDSEFAKTGAKIGTQLRIRLPNDYVVGTGAAVTPQDTNEQSTTLTTATQKNVPITFSSLERTMKLDDFSDRILKPMINNLAGAVAADIMSGADDICNMAYKDNGSGSFATPDASTFLDAGAMLDLMSCPRGDRKIILDPRTQARTVSSLAGLFNPQRKVSDQYASGMMSEDTLGFDWMMDQTVLKHTSGTFTAGTVNGGSQTGSTLTVNAITGTLKKGDIITIAGVYSVNRVTKQSTGELQQFVVTADVAGSGTSIGIYPPITPPSGGDPVAYQTVTASPANSATITLVCGASKTSRKNIAFHKSAITMATADLELPKGVHEAARHNYDGVSMRMVSQYNVSTDQFITRLDIVYGYKWVRPEWGVIIPDTI